MEFLIEATHPRWGSFQLKAKRVTYGPKQQYLEYLFEYPNGLSMGSLDQECGGLLDYHSYEIAKFMRPYKELLDLDVEAYCWLEKTLAIEIHKRDPTFFSEEVKERFGF